MVKDEDVALRAMEVAEKKLLVKRRILKNKTLNTINGYIKLS